MILLFFLTQLSATEFYNLGNKFYSEGKFDEAIVAYDSAVKKIVNGDLYYNLGNAYFKKGQIGKAIVNYRRAYILKPRDRDIIHNLDFARAYRVDKLNIIKNPLIKFLADFFHFFSLYEASILSTLSFVVISCLIAFYLILSRRIAIYLAGFSSFLFFYFFITGQIWLKECDGNQAVVVVPEVTALSGPSQDHKEILLIHDGTEIKIRDERGDYILVQLPGGMGGWISKEAIERILP